jgi:SARP family transcriptional regulator, regulator of embCAB operon
VNKNCSVDGGIAIDILGPLIVTIGGHDITPRAPKQRQVVGLLALNANRVVTISMFIDELWNGDAPKSAQTTLQTYVMNIRKLFAKSVIDPTTSRGIVLTSQDGYLLRINPESMDIHRFEEASINGRLALAHGNPEEAAHHLRSALSLWTGPAFADVTLGQLLEPRVRGLHDAYLLAVESRIEADLQCDRHRDVLSELATLIAEHPLHENLHGQAMRALHRAGRRSEALGIFSGLRSALIRELGHEPSEKVRRVQQAILAAR